MWEAILDDFQIQLFTWPEVIFRACLALLFGFLIGWERDYKNKPMDFRAYMIICVTTCLLAIMGQELYIDYAATRGGASPDFSKLIDGMLTGIGFLGAGAILKRDDRVIGTATGASVWAAGGIGMVIGFGFYGIATIGFIAVISTLWFGGLYMKVFNGHDDKEKNLQKEA